MPKTKCSISFGLYDVTAKEDSLLAANDLQGFVDLNELRRDDLVLSSYATCEKNQFMLDGAAKLLPDDTSTVDLGWWTKNSVGRKPLLFADSAHFDYHL